MKKLVPVGIILLVLVAVFFASQIIANKNKKDLLSGKYYIEMVIKNKGTITAELDADEAPITVTNFVHLVENHFYDGLTFHRIIEGFMMQGGQANASSDTSLIENIKGEFKSNGVENNIKHERGVLSMARSDKPNSASTEFFIMHQTTESLDGNYAAFGHVLSGIEVVDDICSNTKTEDSNGTVDAKNQPVIESIRLIEKPE